MSLLSTQPKYRQQLAFAVTLVILSLFLCSRFLIWAQARSASPLDDQILKVLPAYDCSVAIFAVIYSLILLSLRELWDQPHQLLVGLYSYSLMIFFRMLTIFIVPLSPPLGLVSLNDPMVQWAFSSNVITKDLFFSGHTATVALMVFVTTKNSRRWLYGLGTTVVGVLVMIQHIHYTIDVLAAPLFAGISYYLVRRFNGWLGVNSGTLV